MDSKKKSFIKTIVWRIISIVTGIIIVYLFTKSISISIWTTMLCNGVSTILYYIHERLWSNIKI